MSVDRSILVAVLKHFARDGGQLQIDTEPIVPRSIRTNVPSPDARQYILSPLGTEQAIARVDRDDRRGILAEDIFHIDIYATHAVVSTRSSRMVIRKYVDRSVCAAEQIAP